MDLGEDNPDDLISSLAGHVQLAAEKGLSNSDCRVLSGLFESYKSLFSKAEKIDTNQGESNADAITS